MPRSEESVQTKLHRIAEKAGQINAANSPVHIISNDSYGFRPNRNCHDALRALSQTVDREALDDTIIHNGVKIIKFKWHIMLKLAKIQQ